MNTHGVRAGIGSIVLAGALLAASASLTAADRDLLDVLLENGVITPEQHRSLIEKETLTAEDVLQPSRPEPAAAAPRSTTRWQKPWPRRSTATSR